MTSCCRATSHERGRAARGAAVPSRLLLIRPDHLGDVLLTLPAAAALRDALPEVRITYLVNAALAAVLHRCPAVDSIVAARLPPADRLDASEAPQARHALAGRLRGKFDAAVVFRPDDAWSASLAQAAAVPVRVGTDFPRTVPFLTHPVVERADRHVVAFGLDMGSAVLDALGSEVALPRPSGPFFVPTDQDAAEAQAANGESTSDEELLLLHPGSGWTLKNWPVQCWVSAARRLAADGWRVLVVGSPGEWPLLEQLVAAASGAAAMPRTPLSVGGLAALQRRASLVVGTDSGALHLAAFVGTPVVGLYGPADHRVFAPWGIEHRIVRLGLDCSPCGTLVSPPCGARRNPACVAGIGVEAVLDAVDDLMGRGRFGESASGAHSTS